MMKFSKSQKYGAGTIAFILLSGLLRIANSQEEVDALKASGKPGQFKDIQL